MRKSMSFRKSLAAFSAALFAALFVTAGWAEEEEEGAAGTKVPPSTCMSGMQWTGGNEGSAEMHPGMSCIDCHASGEGPHFAAAGTVFRRINEPDDCYGVSGVIVQLTDAGGKVHRMMTNRAGNFSLPARGVSVSFPIRAKLFFEGRGSQMTTPQHTANCAGCHTAAGRNGAPGRIVAP